MSPIVCPILRVPVVRSGGTFDPSEHPRAPDGKFTSGGGGGKESGKESDGGAKGGGILGKLKSLLGGVPDGGARAVKSAHPEADKRVHEAVDAVKAAHGEHAAKAQQAASAAHAAKAGMTEAGRKESARLAEVHGKAAEAAKAKLDAALGRLREATAAHPDKAAVGKMAKAEAKHLKDDEHPVLAALQRSVAPEVAAEVRAVARAARETRAADPGGPVMATLDWPILPASPEDRASPLPPTPAEALAKLRAPSLAVGRVYTGKPAHPASNAMGENQFPGAIKEAPHYEQATV